MIFTDARGSLLSCRRFSDLPFAPKSFFVVYDVPANTIRGRHAHFENKQYLICGAGRIRVALENGDGKREVFLNAGDSLFHDSMEWGEFEFLTGKDMLISVCSEEYDEADYIRDYDRFKTLIG